MPARLILLVLLLLTALTGHAQYRTNTDYYSGMVMGDSTLFKKQLGNVERHLPTCESWYQDRRYPVHFGNCEFILNYFPNHPQALLNLTQICLAWKDPRCDPTPYLQKAIEVNPQIAATYTIQGVYLLRTKKLTEAIESLKHAADLDPTSFNAQYNLGLAYLDTKQFDLANQHAQLAYRLGAPLPGLRELLQQAGHWKPLAKPPPAASPDSEARQ